VGETAYIYRDCQIPELAEHYIVPPVLGGDDQAPVDEDLSLALIFWALDSERERGGGFIRKKDAERITQVSFLYRPVLIKKYGNSTLAFDGCGISSTQFKFGIAPSLTYLRSYLISEDWVSKPESFAAGLDRHSQEFERAHEENSYEVRGWITESNLVGQLSNLLRRSVVANSKPETLLVLVDFDEIRDSLDELDKIKRLLYSENAPLKDLKQVLNEKTAEVLAPLNEECVKIERQYNEKIDRIRPSVLESKRRYENQRMNHIQQIEARMSRKMHALRDKQDAAEAKIAAYENSEREPKGGIARQYSIRDSTRRRIRELEDEQKEQIEAVNKKYDELIEQAQNLIDSLEDEKERALEEPKRKISMVTKSANRLNRAIDQLIKDHDSIIKMEASSSIIRPAQVDADEFTLYLPTIIARFDDGKKPHSTVFSVVTMKQSKGVVGALKGLVGMKSSPLEKSDEGLTKFVASYLSNPKVSTAALIAAKQNDVLLNPSTKDSVYSGVAKLQSRGLIKQNEAVEFQEAVENYFVPMGSQVAPVQQGSLASTITEKGEKQPLMVRFVNYRGTEKWVEIDKLETLREQDQNEFASLVPSLRMATSESSRLLGFLRNLKIPHTKQYCIDQGEDWVQNQLYIVLVNSEFGNDVHRERTFNVGVMKARIDFDVRGVGVEVKIFRSMQDFDRLTKEMLNYGEKYHEIIIPYINAGGMSNEQLEAELRLLSKHYPQIKGYFALNCNDL
jgi:hypothetical protein